MKFEKMSFVLFCWKIEDSLTDYEKRKIAEEKERVRQSKSNQIDTSENVEENKKDSQEIIPLYRMPVGLKRIELENLKKPGMQFATLRIKKT